MKKHVFGPTLVVGLSLVAAVLTGCGNAPEASEGVTASAVSAIGLVVPVGGSCVYGADTAKCVSGSYCAYDVSAGGVCSATGICTEGAPACSDRMVRGGLCGCDGKDYANSCLAANAGVTVAHQGPCSCEVSPEGNADETCASGYYCDVTVSNNGACASHGTCTAHQDRCPELCTENAGWCGCDGKHYTGCNACLAAEGAPVSFAYAGACE